MHDWVLLRDALLHRAAHDTDRLAYDDGTRRVTFGELAEHAAAQAAGMRARGVTPGDHVALALSPGVAWAEAFWAVQLLGAVPCALNPHAGPAVIAKRVAAIDAALVVTDEVAAGLGGRAGDVEPAERSGEELAFLQPTSGTSGESRIAMLRHRNVLASLASYHGRYSVDADDVLVAWVPPWHDLGLVRFMIGAVAYGAACHVVEPSTRTIPRWLARVGEVGGTVTAAPDFCYRIASRVVDPATVDLSSLRFTTNGGEPVRRSSVQAFEERFGVSRVVLAGYGLAEATLGVTSSTPEEPLVVDARGGVGCGQALPGIELVAGLAPDAPEEIRVRGEVVFAGYLGAPEDTALTLQDGWLHTGDVGYLDEEGRLFVLGRRSGMVKRGGAAISPRELEEAAHDVPGVKLAAACGVDDGPEGTDVITVVVEASVEGDARTALAAEVSRAVAAAVGFAPGRVLVVPSRTVPITYNGKIRHAALRTALAEGSIG